MEAVHRRDDREARAPPLVRRSLDLGRDRRLSGTRRPGDPEQEASGRAVDGPEQPVDYSLLEAAQRLIPLSVA
jgi:hypothetical protein